MSETLLSRLPCDVSFSSDFFSVLNALVSTDEGASLSLAVVTDLAAFNDGFFSLDDDQKGGALLVVAILPSVATILVSILRASF